MPSSCTIQREAPHCRPCANIQLASIERDLHGLLHRLADIGADAQELALAGFHIDAARDALRRLAAA